MPDPAYISDSGLQSVTGASSGTYSLTPTAGAWLLVAINNNGSRTITVSDDVGGSWTQICTLTATNQAEIWVSFGRAAVSTLITVNFGATTTGNFAVLQGSEASLVDTSSTFANSVASSTFHCGDVGLIDTAASICMICTGRLNSGTTLTPPTGFTRIGGGSSSACIAYKFAATAETDQRGTWSLAANRTGPGAIASIKAVAASTNPLAGQLLLLGSGA
jgi:hypothetical protein